MVSFPGSLGLLAAGQGQIFLKYHGSANRENLGLFWGSILELLSAGVSQLTSGSGEGALAGVSILVGG